jgi:hypothetical protein
MPKISKEQLETLFEIYLKDGKPICNNPDCLHDRYLDGITDENKNAYHVTIEGKVGYVEIHEDGESVRAIPAENTHLYLNIECATCEKTVKYIQLKDVLELEV